MGYVEYGKFHKLFNARLPLDHPSNELGVPPGHIPLQLREYTLDPIPSLPSFISSQTSSEAGADASLTAR